MWERPNGRRGATYHDDILGNATVRDIKITTATEQFSYIRNRLINCLNVLKYVQPLKTTVITNEITLTVHLSGFVN